MNCLRIWTQETQCRKFGCTLKGRTATHCSKKGSEKVLRRFWEGFWGRVLRRVLRMGLQACCEFYSTRGFWEGFSGPRLGQRSANPHTRDTEVSCNSSYQENQIDPWPRYKSIYTTNLYHDTANNCIAILCRSIRVRGRWNTPKKRWWQTGLRQPSPDRL